jgi:hypothetical protein
MSGPAATRCGGQRAGPGVTLVNGSLAVQPPAGIGLLDVAHATPALTIQAAWRRDDELPALDRAISVISGVADREGWLR